ncbi:imidazole glycerol phosphate synthase subunit HisH, partial [Rhizobium ruizarguesonis]
MRVAIIDYGSGNLRSATKAFERAAREAGIDAHIDLTDRAEDVAAADRIVLPGVGAYADCRRGLDAVPGMAEVLIEAVEKKARPFLGICVGMQ